MKKLLLIAAVVGFTVACNDGSKSSTTSTDTAAVAPVTTAPAADSSTVSATPALKDGLMELKDGKVQILKGGTWVALDAPVTCTNGRKVSVNGEVSKGDKKRKLEEGWRIDQDGQISDKDGKLVDTSGWD